MILIAKIDFRILLKMTSMISGYKVTKSLFCSCPPRDLHKDIIVGSPSSSLGSSEFLFQWDGGGAPMMLVLWRNNGI